jgi:hypothetical protein
MIVSRHVVFDEDSFPLAASPSLTDLDFLCKSGPTVFTIGTHLTTTGTSPPAPRRPAPEIPPSFEPPVANLSTPTVPPGFLPRAATTATPPPVTIGSPTHTWSSSPVTYVQREVGAGAAGTCGAPGAALHREVDARATGPRAAPGAALRRDVGASATGTCGAPGAALRRDVGAGATPGAARAGRRAPAPRGHVAPPDPPQARRCALEPRGHVVTPELSCVERWVPEPWEQLCMRKKYATHSLRCNISTSERSRSIMWILKDLQSFEYCTLLSDFW